MHEIFLDEIERPRSIPFLLKDDVVDIFQLADPGIVKSTALQSDDIDASKGEGIPGGNDIRWDIFNDLA